MRPLTLGGIVCLFWLSPWVAPTLFADTTEIRFTSGEPTPVFRISSLVVEPSGLSLASDLTEVARKMELLALAPATITVPNGDLWLTWGGTDDFGRTFFLHATGKPLEVRLLGNRTWARWSLYAAGFGALALAITGVPGASGSVSMAVPIGSGVVALAGLVGLLTVSPRVEVSETEGRVAR